MVGWDLRLIARWTRYASIFGIWTILGLFDAAQSYLSYAAEGHPLSWSGAVMFGLALWYSWAILCFFIFRFTERYPFEQHTWPERLVLHLAAGIFFALVKLCMDYPVVEIFYCPEAGLRPFMEFFRVALLGHFHPYVLIYWAMVGVWHAKEYYLKYRDREQKSEYLEQVLSRARLHLLRSQIHPHFLFNTLNSIATLIHRDVDLADRMIARLGELLRTSMENVETHEVALRYELDFTRAYLEIEQLRFGESLEVEIAIDEGSLDARVPFLILQPLVENAIRHGIAPNGHCGRVAVRSELIGKTVRLTVEDSGCGCTLPQDFKERIGLSNTRARLVQLYGDDQQLELSQSPLGGLAVSIEIPLVQSNSDALICR
jgi:two-component system LytT family sensor kinase